MALIYCPVSTSDIDLLNGYHPNCLVNPVRQNPILQSNHPTTKYFADSGGYQLYRYQNHKTKKCIVVSAVGNRTRSKYIVIDPIDLCRKYGQLQIKCGFTLDRPLSDDASNRDFLKYLGDSFNWAEIMFEQRSTLCPSTELFIPLQYSSVDQLHHYFQKMDTLKPNGYAFPVRGSFDLKWLMWITFTLSYLHSMGVKKVHMLGSTRKEIIYVGAVALGLKMFEQVSFDSTSWNTLLFDKRPKHFAPDTLKARYINKDDSIEIIIPEPIAKQIIASKKDLDRKLKEQLIMLHNAFAITRYTQRMEAMAQDINAFQEFIKSQDIPKSRVDRILRAITVLIKTREKGHDFVANWLDWLWQT